MVGINIYIQVFKLTQMYYIRLKGIKEMPIIL
jgi:hypothetical protein